MLLKGAVAILTGAGKTRGIGAATAKLLAVEGCRVLINTLKSEEEAQNVVESCHALGVEADAFIGDITQASTCHAMAEAVGSKWGRADIVINCAGLTKAAPYEKLDRLTAEDFAKLFAVNVTAPYLIAQAFQPLLRAAPAGAALVNVTSAAGITGKGSSIAYAAAKGGANTLTLALAQALSPEVRVNAVCPSFVDSSWWESAYKDKPEEYQKLVESMRESTLLRKVLTPQDVAETILSIVKNPVMTGELIRLDAGGHIGKANQR